MSHRTLPEPEHRIAGCVNFLRRLAEEEKGKFISRLTNKSANPKEIRARQAT